MSGYAYFGYINGTFNDLSGVIHNWASISEKLIVYQHGPDDGAANDHCHILVLGIQLDTKQLYKRKDFKQLGLDGTAKQFGFAKFIEGKDTIAYMSKGEYDPVYNKGFTQEEIDMSKIKGYNKKDKKIEKKSDEKYNEWELIKKDFIKVKEEYGRPCLQYTRTWTMRWYWKRDGRLPHVGNYKRNAASLFYGWTLEWAAKYPADTITQDMNVQQIMEFAY